MKIFLTVYETHVRRILALNYVGYDLPKSKLDELWSNYGREITMRDFQRILNEEKPIDQRSIEEAFEVLYNKDRKTDWNAVDYQRFRTDMLEVGSIEFFL